jgi:dolichyl-phosphate-mannose--protein O-mannosyl transferase/Gpi18-like mannosyltransferase
LSSETNKVINENKLSSGFMEKIREPETKSVLILLGIALIVRLLISLMFNTGHPTDINNFRAWCMEVSKRGIHDFFQPPPTGVWCDYPPGYIYILYALGSIYKLFDPSFQSWNTSIFTTLIKLPGIISDVINIYLIYYLTRRYVPFQVAIGTATIYAFHPAIFYESAIWGQMDSVIMLFLLLSVIYLIDHKYSLSIIATALGCMIKPQGILLIPFLAFVMLYNKAFKQILIGILASLAFIILMTLPVTDSFSGVFTWLWEHYIAQANLYPYSSIQTFNLWSLTGVWKNDSREILGITHKIWGIIFFGAFYISCLFYYVFKSKEKLPKTEKEKEDLETELKIKEFKLEKQNELNNIDAELEEIKKTYTDERELKMREVQLEKLKKYKSRDLEEADVKFNKLNEDRITSIETKSEALSIIHAASLILLGFFLFPTRMHERYLFVGLSFLAISTALNFNLKNLYYMISATFLINLFFEFPGTKTDLGVPQFIINWNNLLSAGHMYTENFGFFWFTPIALLNIYIVFAIILKLWLKPLLSIDFIELLTNTDKEKSSSKEVRTGFSVPKIQKIDKNDWLIILGISVTSFLVRIFYLNLPEEMIFDEVYHARAAGEYLRSINPFEWVHPPLSKLIISSGVWLFGLNSFGWRIMPVIFGTFFVPVMYIFGKTLFSKRGYGILAAVLVSIDGVYFVQSRTAMTNIFATFFQVTAVLFFWLYFQHDYYQEKKSKVYTYLTFSGLFISLALASRWTSMGALAFILGALLWYKFFFNFTLKDLLTGNFNPIIERITLKEIPFWLLIAVNFMVLPAIVYLLAYIPYMSLHHNIHDVIEMQKGIYSYHKNLRDPHPYYSEWYTWPFLIRPTWYYFRDFKNGTMAGIVALGNPAIWWSSLFATAYVLYKAIKEKSLGLLYIGLGFVILYLPWAVSPRIKNFSHYFFEAIPYACLSITYIVGSFWEKGDIKKEYSKEDKNFNILAITAISILLLGLLIIGGLALWVLQLKHPFPIAFLEPYSQKMFNSATYMLISLIGIVFYTLYENFKFRTLSIIYVCLTFGLFLFFYPLYSGYPMYWWYYSLHIWLPSWI